RSPISPQGNAFRESGSIATARLYPAGRGQQCLGPPTESLFPLNSYLLRAVRGKNGRRSFPETAQLFQLGLLSSTAVDALGLRPAGEEFPRRPRLPQGPEILRLRREL